MELVSHRSLGDKNVPIAEKQSLFYHDFEALCKEDMQKTSLVCSA